MQIAYTLDATATSKSNRDIPIKIYKLPLTEPVYSYIDELLEENRKLRNGDSPKATSNSDPSNLAGTVDRIPIPDVVRGSSARNPLFEDRPWFHHMNTSNTPILIGEAADAAFATRFRQAIFDANHIPRTSFATDEKLVSLANSHCQWPAPSRARFLV